MLTETFGWVYAFYVPAIITVIVTIMWFIFVYDSPAQHPRINIAEREYIEKSLGDKVSKQNVWIRISFK